MSDLITLDCESYPNYFLICFENIEDGRQVAIEARGEDTRLSPDQIKKLMSIMLRRETFGFNSNKFDLLMIFYAMGAKTTKELNELCEYIIKESQPPWVTKDKFGIEIPQHLNHFDLYEPAPGVRVSLKLYAARLHAKSMIDLPIEPGTTLTETEMDEIKAYCFNDLQYNIILYNEIKDRIDLRRDMSERYGIDVRSRSDAQIAEVVIRKELKELNPGKFYKKPELTPDVTFTYSAPDFIKFKNPNLNLVLHTIMEHKFELDGRGSIKLPDELKTALITIGGSSYQMGIGGLHSTEHKQAVFADDDHLLIDKDVASYYPSIILQLKLYPTQLGPEFLNVYQGIVDERLKAKHEGNKVVNESLKIVINGSFGKLGSKYSLLYAPDLMMTVTLTGQLALLMLIEQVEALGCSVVSANTDGFVTRVPRHMVDVYHNTCFEWELATGFVLEDTHYKALYSRDVNNFIGIKTDGTYKGKGVFAPDGINKNPQASIVPRAVAEYLVNDTPIERTVNASNDVRDFITARTVSGGAVWRDQYLGRVARWVYSHDGDKITYKKNGNKVANSDSSEPVMVVGELPCTLAREAYIDQAYKLLKSVGVK